MAVSAAPTALNNLVKTAAAVARAGLKLVGGPLRDRGVGAAASNLRLSLAVLLTGMGLLTAIVALPVLTIVFALSVGVSHGLNIASPTLLPPGPPLAPGQLACPLPGAVTTQPFGPSELDGEPAMFGFAHFHTGIDLALPAGTPIRAAEAGKPAANEYAGL